MNASIARHASFDWTRPAYAAVVAVALNLVLYAVARSAGWIPDDLPKDAEMVSAGSVIVTSALGTGLAGGLAWLLDRFTSQPAKWFIGIAIVALLVSLMGPLGIAGAAASLKATLTIMHLIAGGAAIAVIPGALRNR